MDQASDKSGGDAGSPIIDIEAIKKENEALKSKLSSVEPRLAKIEEEEKRREEKLKKDAEEKRKKELGVETVLKEKDEALTATSERLAALEKRERERVDALFDNLPEEFRKPIESMKDKLQLEDWSELVNKQADAADEITSRNQSRGNFSRPSPGQKESGQPSAHAMKLLDEIGKGRSMIGKMKVVQEMDPESGHKVTKFTRHIHNFLGDMERVQSRRLIEKGK